MSRLIFEARRRLPPPPTDRGTITIEPPPELPRVVPPSFLQRALPVVIVILIVGMVIAMVATGMRLISPVMLFFPFALLVAAAGIYRGGGDKKARTVEVDAERADYLRYLSVVRDNIRAAAAKQRAAAEWSHPDPSDLAAVPGSRRQWERDPHDGDFLVVRTGRHSVPLA
ncbi:MAG TPA: type VII secretion protein EccC, partial [Mycobacterium sp.]|nr:type VII secretion protein EccC [Mycobacterium sp.]